MNKQEGIHCLKCGKILSQDELKNGRCNRCKAIDDGIFQETERRKRKHGPLNKEPLNKSEMARLETVKLKYQRPTSTNEGVRNTSKSPSLVGLFIGIIVICTGIIAFLIKSSVLSGSLFSYMLPISLTVIGIIIIFKRHN
ncbi:MAG: hypothetical protein PHR43_04340 [Dehalococcoidales bacterium]|nr:hypothetical protein [Dehalococcoidales bacterium]